MGYQLPTFNLPVNIWRHGNPTSNPPDLMTRGNLALGRRVAVLLAYTSTSVTEPGGLWLLLPAGTDIRDAKAAAGADVVEAGAGSGRFYNVVWVDDVGAGFPNEHRFAEVVGLGPWPTPFPRPFGGGAPPTIIPLGITSGVIGTDPAPLTFTAAAGLRMAFFMSGALAPTAPTITSSLTGALPLISSLTVSSGLADSIIISCYLWTSPGGAETITSTTAGHDAAAVAVCSLTGTVLDQTASGGVSGTSAIVTTMGGLAVLGESLLAQVVTAGLTVFSSPPSGWFDLFATTISIAIPDGTVVNMKVFDQIAANTNPVNVTFGFLPSVPSGGWNLACVKP